ncbi:hypothetical protein D3C80_2179820 [compost metagenome]
MARIRLADHGQFGADGLNVPVAHSVAIHRRIVEGRMGDASRNILRQHAAGPVMETDELCQLRWRGAI